MKATRVLLVGGGLLVSALLSILLLWIFAPEYLFHLGFPLDDSWIHAVYGRSLAASGTLAYNPGIPANGETSPLWAVVFALPHLFTSNPQAIVVAMKLIGLLLHAATAMLAWHIADRLRADRLVAAAAAGVVLLHPDLLAASVSGMEVPLATFLGLWTVLEVLRGPSWRLALVCLLAPLGRPEIACVGLGFLTARAIAGTQPRVLATAATVLAGTFASFLATALRNYSITGYPMPATFYAKVGNRGLSPFFIQWVGFHDLLGHFPIVGSLFLLIPLTLLALWLLIAPRLRRGTVEASTAGALLLTGVGFCSISFALVAPLGHTSFYFQRYALPGVAFMLAALPMLLDELLRALPTARQLTLLRVAVTAALAVAVLGATPGRLHHLENDARNIDDVQVAEGKSLAQVPASTVVWAVDAGAIRYFGNAFVVDTMGLNSPDMLRVTAQQFLQAHQPSYISFVNGWTDLDQASREQMQVSVFKPSTPYTVTGFLPQAVHILTRCPSAPHHGRYAVFDRSFDFICAAGG
jgi:hypothetical protein